MNGLLLAQVASNERAGLRVGSLGVAAGAAAAAGVQASIVEDKACSNLIMISNIFLVRISLLCSIRYHFLFFWSGSTSPYPNVSMHPTYLLV